jgi:fructokinase
MSVTLATNARIGIDVGGTKIEIVALDAGGREIARERTPTPKEYGPLMRTLRELALGLESRLPGAATIGIGFPGSPSPRDGLWRNSNMTFCNGRPLAHDIALAFGREIRLENDANCFALSEAIDGAGAGLRVVFAGTLGTGVGGGLAIGGRLHAGPNHLGGEWGHSPLPWPKPDELPLAPCFCGLQGCAEQYISGTGLARDHKAHGGDPVSAEEILRLRDAGDRKAGAAVVPRSSGTVPGGAGQYPRRALSCLVAGSRVWRTSTSSGRVRELSFGSAAHQARARPRIGKRQGAAWLWNN